jgi:hypothetical protein
MCITKYLCSQNNKRTYICACHNLKTPMPQPSITQQVIKYCQMGFFPICKLQNGQYLILTPFQDKDGYFKCSWRTSNLDKVKENLDFSAFYSFTNPDNEYTPTEIIGFYHPPFKPFEAGDRVIPKGSNSAGEVMRYHPISEQYAVLHDKLTLFYYHFELEPYLETTLQETIKDGQAIQIGEDTFEITPELITVLKNLKKIN